MKYLSKIRYFDGRHSSFACVWLNFLPGKVGGAFIREVVSLRINMVSFLFLHKDVCSEYSKEALQYCLLLPGILLDMYR